MTLRRGCEIVAIALAAWFVVVLLVLLALRLGYPFETDWLEGAMLEVVGRVARGEAIYVEPDIHFTMAVYAPLYFWLAGGLASVLGEGFVAPRIVSIAAVFATLWLLARFVRRAGGCRTAALVAVGCYAAMFDAGDAYFDATRVDSLFVALWFLAAYGACFWRGRRGALALGLCCALAIATKQSALVAPLPFAFALWVRERSIGVAVTMLLAAYAPVLVGFFWLDSATDGWAHYFLVGQLAHHQIEANMWRGFWTRDIARVLPIGALASVWLTVSWGRRGVGPSGSRDRSAFWAWLAVLALGIVIAYASRLHRGGALNVVFPAWLVLSLGLGLAIARASRISERWRIGLLVLAAAQLAMLWYAPSTRLPTAADVANGERLVAEIAAVDGEVLVPFHGAIARRAGKRPAAHPVMINDVLRSADLGVRERYRASLGEALASRRFARVFLEDTVSDPWFTQAIETHYVEVGRSPVEYRWLGASRRFPIRVLVPR